MKLLPLLLFAIVSYGQSLDCTSLLSDPAGYVTDAAKVEAAAAQLKANGADVFVRVVSRLSGATPAEASTLDPVQAYYELNCPNWQAANGGRKNNLITVLVAIQDRRTGIYYGSRWEKQVGPVWSHVQGQVMNPLFKKGDYSAGIAAGLERLAKLTEAPVVIQSSSEDSTVVWWVLGACAVVVGGIMLVVVVVSRKREREQEELEQRRKAATSAYIGSRAAYLTNRYRSDLTRIPPPSSGYTGLGANAPQYDPTTDLLNPLNPLSPLNPISPFNPANQEHCHHRHDDDDEPRRSSSSDSSSYSSSYDSSSSFDSGSFDSGSSGGGGDSGW